MPSLLIREKPLRVLLLLKNTETVWYFSKLARGAGVSFVYLFKFLPRLEQQGLVRLEKQGKKRIVVLTPRGIEAAQLLDDIKRRLDEPKKEPIPREG